MVESKLLWSVLLATLLLTGLAGCGAGTSQTTGTAQTTGDPQTTDTTQTSVTTQTSGTTQTTGTTQTSGNPQPTAAVNGTATLTWNAPTAYTNGSHLDPFSVALKYKIHYGTSSGTYTQTAEVTNPTTAVDAANPATITVTSTLSLAPGTYFFVVACIDASGQESGYSNEVSKTIP
jgi:hypothetical protein